MRVKKAVIPAAGFGTRMLPVTKTIPKEMLPILNKPVIQYAVEEAVASGIEDIAIITGRGKSSMEDYFDYTPELEDKLINSGRIQEAGALHRLAESANICFIRQKEMRGLGDAVWQARSFIGQEPFAVLLPDDIIISLVPVTKQLIQLAEDNDADVLGIQSVAWQDLCRYSSLKVEPLGQDIYRVLDLIEKPRPEEAFSSFAVLGRYVLKAAIFDILAELAPGYNGEIQLTDAIKLLRAKEDVLAVDFQGKRYDTGNIKGFLEANIDYALNDPEHGDWLKAFLKQKLAERDL